MKIKGEVNKVVQLFGGGFFFFEYCLISFEPQFLLQILNNLDDLYQFDMVTLFTTLLNHQRLISLIDFLLLIHIQVLIHFMS